MDPVAIGTGVTVVVAALAAIGATARWVRRAWRQVEDVLDDWRGEPARPGVPGRPGVMSRLESIETRLGDVDDRVRVVEAELRPNGGGSVKDAINRIDEALSNQ